MDTEDRERIDWLDELGQDIAVRIDKRTEVSGWEISVGRVMLGGRTLREAIDAVIAAVRLPQPGTLARTFWEEEERKIK